MTFLTRITRFLVGVTVMTMIVSCSEPKLRTDLEGDSDSGAKTLTESSSDDLIERKRRAVIGQTFESLTLGSRRFSNAEIRDITDDEIVVAHAEGVDRVPWSEVPEEVQEKWGYDPGAKTWKNRIADVVPGAAKKEGADAEVEIAEVARETAAPNPGDLADRARKIAQGRQRLSAQAAGIQILDSDLSRHSIQLNILKAELQRIRILKSNQGGGIRVERLGGESTLVNRGQQIRELESKVRAEEQLVAQLSKSLQKARADYVALSQEIARLEQQ